MVEAFISTRIDNTNPAVLRVYTPPLVSQALPEDFKEGLQLGSDALTSPSDVHQATARVGKVLVIAGLAMLGKDGDEAWSTATEEPFDLQQNGEGRPTANMRKARNNIPKHAKEAWDTTEGLETVDTLLDLGTALGGLAYWSQRVSEDVASVTHTMTRNGRSFECHSQQQHSVAIEDAETGRGVGRQLDNQNAQITRLIMALNSYYIDEREPRLTGTVHYAAVDTAATRVMQLNPSVLPWRAERPRLTINTRGWMHQTIGNIPLKWDYGGNAVGIVRSASRLAKHMLALSGTHD